MIFVEWITINYDGLLNLANKIDRENGKEVLHFTIHKLLEQDQQFLDELEDDNKLKYISRTIKLQSKSETSQYYREVKRYTIITDDVILPIIQDDGEEMQIKEAQLNFIEDQLNQMNWFSALLFRRWIETNMSAQMLADNLLIPLTTCQYHLRKVKNQIRKEWNKNKHLYI